VTGSKHLNCTMNSHLPHLSGWRQLHLCRVPVNSSVHVDCVSSPSSAGQLASGTLLCRPMCFRVHTWPTRLGGSLAVTYSDPRPTRPGADNKDTPRTFRLSVVQSCIGYGIQDTHSTLPRGTRACTRRRTGSSRQIHRRWRPRCTKLDAGCVHSSGRVDEVQVARAARLRAAV
jgi:hypothetical protein